MPQTDVECACVVCMQVYLQHTPQTDIDDDVQNNINSELDALLSISNRYTQSAHDFPPLADNHFCPGRLQHTPQTDM